MKKTKGLRRKPEAFFHCPEHSSIARNRNGCRIMGLSVSVPEQKALSSNDMHPSDHCGFAAVRFSLSVVLSAVLCGCASNKPPPATAEPVVLTQEERSWGRSLGDVAGRLQAVPHWENYRFPGKEETRYDFVRTDGRVAVQASSLSSASMLRAALAVSPDAMGKFHFSWKVPSLIEGADMGTRESDDAPARVVLAFDGDRSRFTMRESAMAELARAITGEEMPYATLMYVWCNQRPAGTVIVHPRSSRVRAIVVESGAARLGQWLAYDRDVQADFLKAFGESPGRLTAVGLMTDTDNTGTRAQAWYGPLRFDAAAVAKADTGR